MEHVALHSTARILIEHPHSYRQWTVVKKDTVRGFWHLKSALRLGSDGLTVFHLVLHESEFEIV
jgi:hypothetical protein